MAAESRSRKRRQNNTPQLWAAPRKNFLPRLLWEEMRFHHRVYTKIKNKNSEVLVRGLQREFLLSKGHRAFKSCGFKVRSQGSWFSKSISAKREAQWALLTVPGCLDLQFITGSASPVIQQM